MVISQWSFYCHGRNGAERLTNSDTSLADPAVLLASWPHGRASEGIPTSDRQLVDLGLVLCFSHGEKLEALNKAER